MAKDMTLLWGTGSVPCWRVMIMLEEKRLQGYDKKLLSFEKMEYKSQEVLDINPRGQLPSFKHGNIVVNESYGICFYLESQFKNQGTKLIPDDTDQQALMYQRMFEGPTFYDKVGAVVYYEYYVPEGERHDSAVKRNREALVTELNLWEGYLQKSSFTFYCLSYVAVQMCYFLIHRLSAQRYPKLGEYHARVKERPSVKASWPPYFVEGQEDWDTLKDI
uniref:Glutathione S-transferase rho n=1 Tax=Acanthochromis polyacanthus TaxID=80966 RepID=A0A3Q1H9X2_9TELE